MDNEEEYLDSLKKEDHYHFTIPVQYVKKWLNDNEIPNVLGKNDSFKRYISSLDYSGTEKRRY